MKKGKVIIMAGGTGITIPHVNTIENKVPKNDILKCLGGKSNINLDEILIEKEESFSIWGYSDNDKNLKNNTPQKNDLIFITNNDAAIYLATVLGVYKSDCLDIFWAGRRSWKNLIVFKNVIRLFIPYYGGKNADVWIKQHPFSPGLSALKYVKKYLDKKENFKNIIEKKDNNAHIQGALILNLTAEKLLGNLFKYCMKTHFECLVKEI